MSTENQSLAQAQRAKPSAAFGARGIEVRQYDELVRFAQTVSESGLAPKGMEKPQAIFVAIQMGLELGLSPMASLQNVAVVNGRPTLWGDAQLAVCRGTGEMEIFEEWYEQGGQKSPRNPTEYKDDTAAVCRVKRSGGQIIEQAFSVADAKRAGLWGKSGPWTQYPFRMLRNRARSFALRDGFGDALRGFRSTEEAMDMPEERPAKGREVQAAEVPLLFSGAAAVPAAEVRSGSAAEEAAAPREVFWRKAEKAGMDDARVIEILRRNKLADIEFPVDLTDEDAAAALLVWNTLVEIYGKEAA